VINYDDEINWVVGPIGSLNSWGLAKQCGKWYRNWDLFDNKAAIMLDDIDDGTIAIVCIFVCTINDHSTANMVLGLLRGPASPIRLCRHLKFPKKFND